MRTPEEIANTPLPLLTEEELATLDDGAREYVQRFKARMAREAACPGHQATGTGTRDEARRGWHPAKCKHCGFDMSVDSGD